MGNFFRVFAHVEVEEWKGGVVSHQQAQGGVEVSLIQLAWYCPTPQLHREIEIEKEVFEI